MTLTANIPLNGREQPVTLKRFESVGYRVMVLQISERSISGSIAQLAERPAVNRKAAGSNPAVPVSGASSNGRAPVL